LEYQVHAAYDLIERRVIAHNNGDTPIRLERIASSQWHLPTGSSYRLSYMHGRWFDEMHIQREILARGIKTLESRRLTTSHQHNPWFALDRGNADEDHGDVWFGVMAWSGNWKIGAEVTSFDQTRLTVGLNDWDFVWTLEPGEKFSTPSAFGGFTGAGFNGASRSLHRYIRDSVLPDGKMLRKVLYNSWEATTFNVDEPSQIRLAEIAAKMGIELFVMDDGWFQGRITDNAGLGDWWPDPEKFPDGLAPLIEHVNALGMDFGLWVEPEMVNPNSDLYRAHPDWVIHFLTRARTEQRGQLILNFGREDVQNYIYSQLDKLLSENNIVFIKWDMNRNVSEPGWPDAPFDQRELWVRYVWGVYKVWGALREKHPKVVWQSCSGGGGRADLGILRIADQIWVSDNTEATARLSIQEGFSQVFPANTMEAWVTDVAKDLIPLEFRFHVSMCGVLGVGGHLLHWTEEDRAEAARYIATYKDIRHIVQFGDLYRLRSPQQGPFSAVQYVTQDQAESVVFAFRTHIPDPTILPRLTLGGLDPNAMYTVDGVTGARSGLSLMRVGIQLRLRNFSSALVRLGRVTV
jgi:alpha-galactosidase